MNHNTLIDNNLRLSPWQNLESRLGAAPEICKPDFTQTRWPAVLAAVLAALVVGWPTLFNDLALDDTPLILWESRYPDWASLRRVFTESYWPPPFLPNLYRPLGSILLHAVRFLGGGAVWPFHAVSLLCSAAVAGALAYWLVPRTGVRIAAGIGVLFAVHPIHTEAVASAVNQGEMAMALFTLLATASYLRYRAAGDLRPSQLAVLSALLWAAAGFKETGVLLPAVLATAEVTLLADPRPWRARVAALRPAYLVLGASSIAFVAIRTVVLDDVRGSFAAPIFSGLTLGERALTMLGVVPELFRLLLWPAHLRIEYSISEFTASSTWGADQTAGLLLLLGLGALTLASVRRMPLAAFGVVLALIAYFPVHNVLFPSGVLIAERTLYLPSLGLALALAAAATLLPAHPPRLRGLAAGLAVLLAVLGAARSMTRFADWKDQKTLWARALVDSPNSWQVNATNAAFAELDGKLGTAERLLRRAIAAAPLHTDPRLALAALYRQFGRCNEARPLFLNVLSVRPAELPARLGLVTCELYVGRYAAARQLSMQGAGYQNRLFRGLVRTSDSALRVGAAPGTVRVPDSTLARVTAEVRRSMLQRAP